jgi:hypothetical protein
MILESLQEAVRDILSLHRIHDGRAWLSKNDLERLESALKREPNAAGQDRVAGDDQQCLSSGATSRSTPSGESPAPVASIMALLAEARGYLEGLELAERIDAALASVKPGASDE